MKKLSKMSTDQKLDALVVGQKQLLDKQEQLSDNQVKLTTAVVDMQQNMATFEQRLGRLENSVEKLVQGIDSLMVLLNRHEAELAAMHDNYRRLEQRIELLEVKLARWFLTQELLS